MLKIADGNLQTANNISTGSAHSVEAVEGMSAVEDKLLPTD
jgi:hypothetical protein